ncbi:MAG: tetratricopeptide repeat protein [Anaerolineae bacterium]
MTAIRNIAALLALADEAHDPARRAEALLWQLRLLNALGDHTGKLSLADEVIQTARVVKQIGLEAQALCLKAAALTRLGEAAAQQTVEEAIACGRVAADEWVIAYASGMLALHESYAGDYARAAQLWTEVFDMVKRSGDRTLESRALSNLGAAYQYLGQYVQARTYLEQGIALCELIGDRRSHAYNVVNLGGVMLLSGDPQSAKKMFEQGLAEAIELNDENLRAGEFGELGGLAVMIGDYAAATQLLEEARQAHAQMELVAHVMENTALLAKCALAEGRQEEARESGGQVWNYLQVHGATAMYEAVPTYLTLIEVFEALAESSRASEDVSTVKSMVEVAYELVAARAEKISEPIWRQSFLQNVPSNRAVVERWQRLTHGCEALNKASEDHTFANKYQTRVCLGSATQHA